MHVEIKTGSESKVCPRNIGIVLDKSGSMRGSIDPCKEAIQSMLECMLRDGDMVHLCAFSSDADVIFEHEVIGETDVVVLCDKVNAIRAHGSTHMQDALREVMEWFPDRSAHNVLIIFSDGVLSETKADPEPTDTVLALLSDQMPHVRCTTYGIGTEYDPELLGEMAKRSGGSYHYIRDIETVQDHLMHTLRMVASAVENATLKIDIAGYIRSAYYVRYSTKKSTEPYRILFDLGSIVPDDTVTLFVVLEPRYGADAIRIPAGVCEMATYDLCYCADADRYHVRGTLHTIIGEEERVGSPKIEAGLKEWVAVKFMRVSGYADFEILGRLEQAVTRLEEAVAIDPTSLASCIIDEVREAASLAAVKEYDSVRLSMGSLYSRYTSGSHESSSSRRKHTMTERRLSVIDARIFDIVPKLESCEDRRTCSEKLRTLIQLEAEGDQLIAESSEGAIHFTVLQAFGMTKLRVVEATKFLSTRFGASDEEEDVVVSVDDA